MNHDSKKYYTVSTDNISFENVPNTLSQELEVDTFAFCNSLSQYDELLGKLTSANNGLSNLNVEDKKNSVGVEDSLVGSKISNSPLSKDSAISPNDWDATPIYSSNSTSLITDFNFNNNYTIDGKSVPNLESNNNYNFLENLVPISNSTSNEFVQKKDDNMNFPFGNESVPKTLGYENLLKIDDQLYHKILNSEDSGDLFQSGTSIQPHLTMNQTFKKVEKPSIRRKTSSVEQMKNQIFQQHRRTTSATSVLSTNSNSIPLPGFKFEDDNLNGDAGFLKADDILNPSYSFEDFSLLSQTNSFDATLKQTQEDLTQVNTQQTSYTNDNSNVGLSENYPRETTLRNGSDEFTQDETPSECSLSDTEMLNVNDVQVLPENRQSVTDLAKINQSSHVCDGCFKISKSSYGCSKKILKRLPNLKAYKEYNTPNGYTLEFAEKHGDPSFVYQRSEQNTVYDPAVKRYSLQPEYDTKGKRMKTDYPSLCPFCKVTPSRSIDDLFYERNNSCYRGHLINTHGISSKGEFARLPTAGFVCFKLGKNSWTETFGFKCPYKDCNKCFIRGDKTHGFHEYIRHWNGKHIQKLGSSP